MADTLDARRRPRRRRADVQRSFDAIVSAARTRFGQRPDASMEEIAGAAGVTRQTVYALRLYGAEPATAAPGPRAGG